MELVKLTEALARALVDYPEQVKVNEITGEQASVIELSVAKQDLGKIIGREGRIAHALRLILSCAAAKEHRHLTLAILE